MLFFNGRALFDHETLREHGVYHTATVSMAITPSLPSAPPATLAPTPGMPVGFPSVTRKTLDEIPDDLHLAVANFVLENEATALLATPTPSSTPAPIFIAPSETAPYVVCSTKDGSGTVHFRTRSCTNSPCKFGSTCFFAHSDTVLSQAVSLRTTYLAIMNEVEQAPTSVARIVARDGQTVITANVANVVNLASPIPLLPESRSKSPKSGPKSGPTSGASPRSTGLDDASPSTSPSSNRSAKVCRRISQGGCEYGASCWFYHPPQTPTSPADTATYPGYPSAPLSLSLPRSSSLSASSEWSVRIQ
jgi:hypothetical protein